MRSVVLYEPPEYSTVGRGCLLPPTVAQDSLICLSASSSDFPLISVHSGLTIILVALECTSVS